jgi:hypothetical protein
MCRSVTALSCGLACLLAPPALGGGFSQLVSTRYADSTRQPADLNGKNH